MHLSPRLQAIADFVPKGSKVADIGTDHGYLLINLIKNNLCNFAIGGDLNHGPYLSAKKSVLEAGLSEKISIRHGNGLEVVKPGEVEVITIAGMGGGTMIEILEAKPQVLKEVERLILQPMIGSEYLRKWLLDNNWIITKERLVEDDGRIYEIIVAEVNDNLSVISENKFLMEFDFVISPLLIENKDPLLSKHIERLIASDERILTQIAKSNSPEANQKRKEYQERLNTMKVILCQLNSKQS